MGTVVYATVINRGKVVDGTHHSVTFRYTDQPTNEQIGSVVANSINLARVQGFHIAAPDIFIQLEFKLYTD